MKSKKSFLKVILCLALALLLVPGAAWAQIPSWMDTTGSCGDAATWAYDDTTKTLTISGTGLVGRNYDDNSNDIMNGYEYLPFEKLVIGEGITSLGSMAFAYSGSLKEVSLPSTLQDIGVDAFLDCDALTSITIPGNVEEIGRDAFLHCDALANVVIENGVKAIGDEAFAYCDKLTSISLPASIEKLGVQTFNWEFISNCFGAGGLKEILVDSSNTKYCSVDGVLFTKDMKTLLSYPAKKSGTSYTVPEGVEYIVENAFEEANLTSITLPSSLKKIGGYAFRNASLTSVDIPSGVTSIEHCAFQGCTGLEEITIPSGVEYLSFGLFDECANLESVTLPATLTEIGPDVFDCCYKLETLNIPAGVTKIGDQCFWCCFALKNFTVDAGNSSFCVVDDVLFTRDMTELVAYPTGKTDSSYTVPSGVTKIRKSAFPNASSLKSVSIPASVTNIAEDNFVFCGIESIAVDAANTSYCAVDGVLYSKDMKKIIYYPCRKSGSSYTVPDGVTTIGANAFEGNDLTSITLPSSVTSIGEGAFACCVNLTDVNIPDGITTIPGGAFDESGLTEVKLPDTVTTIDYSAYCMSKLKTANLPKNLTTIVNQAFYHCTDLQSVYIPKSVTDIANLAFLGCDALTDVYYEGSVADWKNLMKHIDLLNDDLVFANIHFNASGLGGGDTAPVAKTLPGATKMVPYELDLAEHLSTTTTTVVGVEYKDVTGYALPDGLEVKANHLTGIPTKAGAYSFYLSVFDGADTEAVLVTLTVQDNTDSNVKTEVDAGYEIITPVPDMATPVEEEKVFKIAGSFTQFENLYLDGVRLTKDVDYTVVEGSTVITLSAQTVKSIPVGKHTIAATFRNESGDLKCAAHNFTVGKTSSGGGSSAKTYAVTTPDVLGGKVVVSPAKATAGEKVTITVTPDKGYVLAKLAVNGAELTKVSETTYTFVMPKQAAAITAEFEKMSDLPFSDVRTGQWFYEPIKFAFDAELMQGISEQEFAPNQAANSAMLVMVLARLGNADLTNLPNDVDYGELAEGAWYTEAAKWALTNGLLGGTIADDSEISRGDIARTIYAFLQMMGVELPAADEERIFADADLLTAEENEALQPLCVLGIFRGNDDNTINPQGATTRAELAVLLQRISEVMAAQVDVTDTAVAE